VVAHPIFPEIGDFVVLEYNLQLLPELLGVEALVRHPRHDLRDFEFGRLHGWVLQAVVPVVAHDRSSPTV